jgi:hypothetical protein
MREKRELAPGGDPVGEAPAPAPTLSGHFAGYALLFGGLVGFAVLLGLLMRILR